MSNLVTYLLRYLIHGFIRPYTHTTHIFMHIYVQTSIHVFYRDIHYHPRRNSPLTRTPTSPSYPSKSEIQEVNSELRLETLTWWMGVLFNFSSIFLLVFLQIFLITVVSIEEKNLKVPLMKFMLITRFLLFSWKKNYLKCLFT